MKIDLASPSDFAIASAMRGPDTARDDTGGMWLEQVFTAAIRYVVGVRGKNIAWRNPQDPIRTPLDTGGLAVLWGRVSLDDSLRHYVDSINTALVTLIATRDIPYSYEIGELGYIAFALVGDLDKFIEAAMEFQRRHALPEHIVL